MRSRLKGCLLGVMLASHTVVFADEAQSYDDALTSFVQGDVQASYLVLKQVLRDNPDHLPSKLLMGRILLIDGYVGEAIDELEERRRHYQLVPVPRNIRNVERKLLQNEERP